MPSNLPSKPRPRATLNSAEGPIIIISAVKKSLDRGVAVGEFLVSDLHTRQKKKPSVLLLTSFV